MTPYQPKFQWVDTWPGETGHDGKPLRDYVAMIDGKQAGRVRYESHGPVKGKWQWSGGWPANWHGTPVMPNQGYVGSLREAVRMCEEYYDKMEAIRGRG